MRIIRFIESSQDLAQKTDEQTNIVRKKLTTCGRQLKLAYWQNFNIASFRVDFSLVTRTTNKESLTIIISFVI